MTICLAVKCKRMEEGKEKPALLFASDTQESSSYLKRSVTKIRPLIARAPEKKIENKETWNMLVASAGDALVIDEALDDISYYIGKKIDPYEDNPSLSLLVHRKEIGDLAYSAYKKYKERCSDDPQFQLLFGAADNFSTILYITNEGKSQELENFGIIGSGRITGGELLINEFLKKDMNEEEAASLAALIVTNVGHIDLSVGGRPDIRMCQNRRVWIYKESFFEEILKTSESKWNLIKKLWWKMQEDSTIENKFRELLSSAKKSET